MRACSQGTWPSLGLIEKVADASCLQPGQSSAPSRHPASPSDSPALRVREECRRLYRVQDSTLSSTGYRGEDGVDIEVGDSKVYTARDDRWQRPRDLRRSAASVHRLGKTALLQPGLLEKRQVLRDELRAMPDCSSVWLALDNLPVLLQISSQLCFSQLCFSQLCFSQLCLHRLHIALL